MATHIPGTQQDGKKTAHCELESANGCSSAKLVAGVPAGNVVTTGSGSNPFTVRASEWTRTKAQQLRSPLTTKSILGGSRFDSLRISDQNCQAIFTLLNACFHGLTQTTLVAESDGILGPRTRKALIAPSDNTA